jgi:signal transduction histidine kinase
MEKRYIRPDDSHVWISMTIAPITVVPKTTPRHLCMIEDITEQKKTENQLKKYKNHLQDEVNKRSLELKASQDRLIHSEKLSTLGKFAGTVAHEFNNPLFGVINLIEQIEQGVSDDERKTFTKLAQKECWRMADMIKNLQSFYKPSEESFTTNCMKILIEEVLLIASKTCNNKGITIYKTYKTDNYSFEGIEDQIKQVILNIIKNSIDSISGDGGKITLSMVKTSKNIMLEIQDTGSGINSANLNFIFDPFFTTKGKEGTGLGLSVSYGIIKKHGGDILIESELGIGCTVTLVIPITRKI